MRGKTALVGVFVLGALSTLAATLLVGLWWPKAIRYNSDTYTNVYGDSAGRLFGDTRWVPGDCCFTGGDWSSGGGPGDPGGLIDRAPKEMRESLVALFNELINGHQYELFLLKAHDDPCSMVDLINCRGIPSSTVKPFIEAALAHRLSTGALDASKAAYTVAAGSLLVSILSLLVSIFRGRRAS